MKKKLPFLSAVVALLFVLISYFAYQVYVRPIYQNNFSQHLTIDLKSSNKIKLIKKHEQDGIFGIEIEITGTSKGNLGMTFNNGQQAIYSAKIKGGDVGFVYKNDWYTDTVFLLFEKEQYENGKLEISYRFLGL